MTLEALGWNQDLDRAFQAWADEPDVRPGRVLIEFNYIYRVWCEGGEIEAVRSGRFTHRATSRGDLPAVGDWVVVRKRADENRVAIIAVLPRRSWFSRRMAGHVTDEQVVAANVDVVFIVMALDDDFSPRRLERYLLLARESGASPVILLTKPDVCVDVPARVAEIAALAGDVPVHVVSPKFAVFWRGRLDRDADDIEFPVIVKPLREDGSIGIGFDALAGNIKELMERIDALTAEFSSPILIEQYIEGREIYMGVLGNAPPEALPPVELDLSHLPKGTPRIAGTEVKWNEGSRAYRGSKIRLPKLPKAVHETMERYALAAFQALGLRDYARIDFRLAGETVYLIEANPNPYLHSGHEFIRGARASGRTHPATILEILECARVRYAAALPR